jgi:hypothetical protein
MQQPTIHLTKFFFSWFRICGKFEKLPRSAQFFCFLLLDSWVLGFRLSLLLVGFLDSACDHCTGASVAVAVCLVQPLAAWG